MNANQCRFFNGVQNKTCKAGVRYDAIKTDRILPCLAIGHSAKMTPDQRRNLCPKLEFPSAEELAEDQKRIDAAIAELMKANDVIAKVKNEHRRKDWIGVEVCPICGGKLHMTHAAYNGHVHGRCETPGCLHWME
jgi:hypothetical protein